MIVQHKHAVLLNLRGQVPVADMPAEFAQMHGVPRQNLQEFLLAGDHFDKLAIVQDKRVTMIERHCGFKIDQHLAAMLKPQDLTAQMALVMSEDDDIPCGAGPFAFAKDFEGGGHSQNRKYRCAIGSTVAGSHVSSAPSALTS